MASTPVSTVLLLGRPGSGKGTQTSLLAQKLEWKTLSSGNTFRELRESEGALGEKIRETYDAGIIFPDWFPGYLLLKSLFEMKPEEGVICEGFARTVDQAKLFDEALEWLGRKYIVFDLVVSEDEAMKRQLGRNKTDARTDSDTPEKIQTRFNEYTQKTAPVVAFFKEKGTLIEINGEESPEQIAAAISEKLQSYL
jgi:adenylate kinase